MNAPPATPQALTLVCARCGGRFEALPESGVASCPYCGQRQAIPAALTRNLARYQAQVAGELGRANEEYQTAGAWEHLSNQNAPARRTSHWIALGVATLVPFLAIVVGLGAFGLGWITREQAGFMGPVVMVSSYGGMIAYVLLYFAVKRKAPGQAVAAAVRVACPNCGAPGELQSGQSAEACRYCHGVLIPTAAIMQSGVAEASRARRRAALEKYRQERQGMANLSVSYALGPMMVVMTVAGTLLMFVVGAGVALHEMLTDDEHYSPALYALVLLVALAIAGGGVGFAAWFLKRRAARRAALESLARQLSGQVVGDLSGAVAWLDRFWPAPYDPAALLPGSLDAQGAFRGYPTLVRWRTSTSLGGVLHLHVLVAAVVDPELAASHAWCAIPTVERALQGCHTLGFDVQLTEAGLFASAREGPLEELRRSPRTLESLSLLAALATIAGALGAEPARP